MDTQKMMLVWVLFKGEAPSCMDSAGSVVGGGMMDEVDDGGGGGDIDGAMVGGGDVRLVEKTVNGGDSAIETVFEERRETVRNEVDIDTFDIGGAIDAAVKRIEFASMEGSLVLLRTVPTTGIMRRGEGGCLFSIRTAWRW